MKKEMNKKRKNKNQVKRQKTGRKKVGNKGKEDPKGYHPRWVQKIDLSQKNCQEKSQRNWGPKKIRFWAPNKDKENERKWKNMKENERK